MMTSLSQQTNITVQNLLQGFVENNYLSPVEIKGLTGNSKQVKDGDLFVALAGQTKHGLDFTADVANAGAVAIIYDANDKYCLQRIPLLEKQYPVMFIPVVNLLQNNGEIASRFYAFPSQHFKLIGITGTDGKTSVTHLLIQALNKLNKKAGSIGTLGYGVANKLKMTHFTTPDAITLQSILAELSAVSCEYVVMEVSSHALQQYRANGCQFDVAVLTNFGSDHLDYHGDLVNYKNAKTRLFQEFDLAGKVLNLDDEFGRSLAKTDLDGNVIGYSSDSNNRVDGGVKLQSSHKTAQGISIEVSTADGLMNIQTGLIGTFNINNLLCCVSVLLQLGFEYRQIEQCMQGLQPIPGRMEYFPPVKNQPAVVIDFAHTEQALSACLQSVKTYCEGRLVCIFGCGGDRDQSKRPKMAAVAEQLADQVIVTDDNPRNESPEQIVRDILIGFVNPEQVRVIHNREVAIQTAMAVATEKDLVIIAGKGHEQFQIVGNKRLPFSDFYVVKQNRKKAIS